MEAVITANLITSMYDEEITIKVEGNNKDKVKFVVQHEILYTFQLPSFTVFIFISKLRKFLVLGYTILQQNVWLSGLVFHNAIFRTKLFCEIASSP